MFQASQYDVFVTNRLITFLTELQRRDAVTQQLYMEVPWKEGDPDRVEFSIGALTAVAGTVGERQRIPAVQRAQSSTLTKKQLQYGQAFEITKRARKFARAISTDSEARKVAMGIKDGHDYDMTHDIFSTAETAAPTHRTEGTIANVGVDGLAPCSTAHLVVGTGATQYSNQVNSSTGLPLTTDNYVTAKQLPNQAAVDEYATPIKADYNTLIIAKNEDMIRKGRQIHGSPKEPEVFENAINIYSDGSQRMIVLTHGDTDRTLAYSAALRYRWMLKADSLSECNQVQIAQEPGIQLESVDENNLAARVVADMFAAQACVTWQDKVYSTNQVAP